MNRHCHRPRRSDHLFYAIRCHECGSAPFHEVSTATEPHHHAALGRPERGWGFGCGAR
ncbi:hypothetical protein BDZ85DRAFT_261941 [Elsinoe ampelina]|uniref:Uncharacterized protein n=1 Tax=Elsinoe ampelina TaxID=302913 RepID=A0A6A6GD79_9PEZI|nr:hypothetical protein BDZ85DRAFT_261941 [Elsinoe ampelina]